MEHKSGARKVGKSSKAGCSIKSRADSKRNFSRRPPHKPPKPPRKNEANNG